MKKDKILRLVLLLFLLNTHLVGRTNCFNASSIFLKIFVTMFQRLSLWKEKLGRFLVFSFNFLQFFGTRRLRSAPILSIFFEKFVGRVEKSLIIHSVFLDFLLVSSEIFLSQIPLHPYFIPAFRKPLENN